VPTTPRGKKKIKHNTETEPFFLPAPKFPKEKQKSKIIV
jgi:hypothetical protein